MPRLAHTRYVCSAVRDVAITAMGVIPENVKLSELLDRMNRIIKELKEKLSDKIEEIAGVLFGLKDGGVILLVHPDPEAARRGYLHVIYGELSIGFRLPSRPDPEIVPKVLNILKGMAEEGAR